MTPHPSPIPSSSVLVIDDDVSARDTLGWTFRAAGFRCCLAATGLDGLTFARAGDFDLLVIDHQLPDILGIEVARCLRRTRTSTRFVLVSGWLTTDLRVEAVMLGASHVMDKPIDADDLLDVVRSSIASRGRDESGSRTTCGLIPAAWQPHSPAERWALYVLKGCESPIDLRVIADWAACSHISASSLRETCYLLRMTPNHACNFMRVLRSLIKSAAESCRLEALLDVHDRRTLEKLLAAGGLEPGQHSGSISIDQFFARQQFVDPASEGVRALRNLLQSPVSGPN